MILLTASEIIESQEKLINATGGSYGLRDIGLLESAIYSASATFDGEEIYSSIEEKSARLAFAITTNHPFVDGNKRIGVFVMLTTLRLNGISLKYSQSELIKLGLGLADGSVDYEAVLKWINAHNHDF